MTAFTLMAVPLFIYMGVMLEKSGIAEELLETMALVFAKVRGGPGAFNDLSNVLKVCTDLRLRTGSLILRLSEAIIVRHCR